MAVPILKQGPFLIATIQAALTDTDVLQLQDADGTPITPGDFSATGGLVRQKPDITAADGVSIITPTGNTWPVRVTSPEVVSSASSS